MVKKHCFLARYCTTTRTGAYNIMRSWTKRIIYLPAEGICTVTVNNNQSQKLESAIDTQKRDVCILLFYILQERFDKYRVLSLDGPF